jgi:DNA-binding CsgD family transcriptional regulator
MKKAETGRMEEVRSMLTTLLDALNEELLLSSAEGAGEDLPPPSAQHHLTRAERTVAHLLAARRTDREIAFLLGTSVRTAQHHVQHVLHKLGVHSRREVGPLLRCGDPQR